MRRSSRGNPWHDARGRFCHGPEARMDTWGRPISDEQREEAVRYSEADEAEYLSRSEKRGVAVGSKYYSKDTANDAPTSKQKRFAEAISKRLGIDLPQKATKKEYSEFIAAHVAEFYEKKPKKSMAEENPENLPDISAEDEKHLFGEKKKRKEKPVSREKLLMPTSVSRGKEGAAAFARQCAEAFGVDTEGVIFYSKVMGRTQGRVGGQVRDGRFRVVHCTITSKRDKNEQIHNTYHETFHMARNGREVGSVSALKNVSELEETAAEVSAVTLSLENGIKARSDAYSEEIIRTLPRLKKMKKYRNCKTMSDFGRVFIDDRKKGNVMFQEEKEAIRNSRFHEGAYLSLYKERADEHFDAMFKDIVRPKDQSERFKKEIREDYEAGFQALKEGKTLNRLTRNQRITVAVCIRWAMEKGEIL